MLVDEVWDDYRRWAQVARRLRRALDRMRSVHLGLVVAGAITTALALQDQWFARPWTVTLGCLSAAMLAAAAVVQTQFLSGRKVRERLLARRTAESFEGLFFLYSSAAPPFAGADPDNVLTRKRVEIGERALDIGALVSGVGPDRKKRPALDTAKDYLSGRAAVQRDWHDCRSAEHRTLATRWRYASIAATGASAVLAAVGGVLGGTDLSAWVGVLATAATAFTAHLASEQHDRIATTYAQTCTALSVLIDAFDAAAATPVQAAAFVGKVEMTLARQNDAWVDLFET